MKAIANVSLILLPVILFFSCKKDSSEPCNASPIVLELGNDTTVNEGYPIVLDAGNAGSSYLWSTGEQSQTIQVDTAGVFWVRVTNCTYTGSDTIRVYLRFNTVKVETDFGNFRIWLYHDTPLHRQNFLSLTNAAFYDSLVFHRVVDDFVIQGGDPEGTGYGGPGYTIPAEIIPGLDHVYGAVGAARQSDYYNPEKESNGSQYYIVCDPDGEPYLNGNYSVFGFVFEGIESVYAISQVPVDTNDMPLDPVFMKKLSVEFFTSQELDDLFGFVVP